MSIVRTTLALAALTTGCTFGVDGAFVDVVADVPIGSFAAVAVDASQADGVRVLGERDGSSIRAALVARGLVPSGELDEARAGVHVAITPDETDATIATVTHSIDGRFAELLDAGDLEITMPHDRALHLDLDSTSAHVDGVQGLVTIEGTSGSVELTAGDVVDVALQSGSVHAEARDAFLRTGSGSMEIDIRGDLDTPGHVDATASSGSIEARLEVAGGRLRTDDGSIDIVIAAPLTEDLVIETGDGSVHVSMARGVGAHVVLEAGDGSVAVHAGHLSFGGGAWSGDIGTPEFTIAVTTGDGSIAIDADEEGR